MIMGLMYVTGAAIYASRVPERWFPGVFDIWVSSFEENIACSFYENNAYTT